MAGQFADPRKQERCTHAYDEQYIAEIAASFHEPSSDKAGRQALKAKITADLTEWKKKLLANWPANLSRKAKRREEKLALRAAKRKVA